MHLFNVLQAYNTRIIPISKENQLRNYSDNKSLLVLDKEASDSVNHFLVNNRFNKNVDIAVLGHPRGLSSQYRKYAILS